MTSETGGLSFRLALILDRISTKWGDVEFSPFGRHRIQPREGRLITILTPQGRTLDVKSNDIIHLIDDNGKVVSRFTSRDLPEGYKIVELMKGDNPSSVKLSRLPDTPNTSQA